MNYLAHMYLTRHSAPLTVGNFLGDMIRNREIALLPGDVQEGVRIHRFIDSYTDLHPLVRDHVKLIRPIQGKYAPVAIDVLYDHILAKSWAEYSQKEYKEFCRSIYQKIERYLTVIPARLQPRAESMLRHGWLEGYDRIEQFRFTLQRLNQRTQFPSRFDLLPDQYIKMQETIDRGFADFFPELIDEVNARINPQNEGRS